MRQRRELGRSFSTGDGVNAFSETIFRYWEHPFAGQQQLHRDDCLNVVSNPALDSDERVTILYSSHYAHTRVALLPTVAQSLRAIGILSGTAALTEERLREGLAEIGIVMHGADNLYYLPQSARELWLAETDADSIRRLDAADAALFSTFESQINAADLAAAQIDLDDWAVFGLFGQNSRRGQLLCAASIYPWGDSLMADVGILTLASARGSSHATRLLRAVGRHAMSNGYELQYRSQLDNKASLALAKAAGLALFGHWEIPSPEDHG